MILTFVSRKGGTGKSTLACSFAAELKSSGKKVCIVDADPQRSSKAWASVRNEVYVDADHIEVFEQFGNVVDTLKSLSKRYDHVIVDCAGKDSLELRSSVLVSDRAIVTTCPSPVDRATLPYVSKLFEDARKENKKLKVKSVITIVNLPSDTKENSLTKKLLKDLGLNPMTATIKQRKTYKTAMSEGLGVTETEDKSAAIEIKSLLREVLK